MRLETYIKQYDHNFEKLMSEVDNKLLKSSECVWTTWIISFDAIRSKNGTGVTATNLLILWSFLDNNDLWYELISMTCLKPNGTFPSWLENIASDELEFIKVVKLLQRYSLIEEVEELGSYSTHPVVHQCVYHHFCAGLHMTERLAAIDLVHTIFFGFLGLDYAELVLRVLPHVKPCIQRILEERGQAHDSADRGELENDIDPVEARYLLLKKELLKHYQIVEESHDFLETFKQKLQWIEGTLDPSDPVTLKANLAIARVYQSQKKLEDATEMAKRVLEGFQKLTDTKSNDIKLKLMAMQFLGELYLFQNRISDARNLIEPARQECESTFPTINSLTLELIFDQAVLSLERGDFAKALAEMKSAKQLAEKEFGPAHELTLTVMYRLGNIYATLDQPIEAERWFNQVADKDKEANSQDSALRPKAAISLFALRSKRGMLMKAQEAYSKAQKASKERKGNYGGNNVGHCLLSCDLDFSVFGIRWLEELLTNLEQDIDSRLMEENL